MHYNVTDSSDVNDHAALLPQWDQLYEQVSAGRFTGRLEDLRLGPVEVFRETTARAVLQRGSARPGTITLGVCLGPGPDARFLGRRLQAGQAFGVVSNCEFELATFGEFDVAAICVDMGYLDAYSRLVDRESFHPGAAAHAVYQLHGADASFGDLVLTTLATACESPRLLDQAPLQRALAQSMCDAVLLHLGAPSGAHAADTTAASRQRVVREARRHMAEHAEEPITVPDLCAAIHVSRRTLQYAFQDVLQMSPVAYLRALRLNGVRRDLRRGGDEPVADRAARWGFWHLSRFAADYRHMFGELPSQTLKLARGPAEAH